MGNVSAPAALPFLKPDQVLEIAAMMTAKQRFLTALDCGVPDRLPVTTHHVMPYFLCKYMNGISNDEFFDYFGLDPIRWVSSEAPDPSRGQRYGPEQEEPKAWFGGRWKARHIETDTWRVEVQEITGQQYPMVRYRFLTPRGTLSMTLQFNEYTSWLIERPIKNARDIDLLGAFLPAPRCDVEGVNRAADEYGERGLVRSNIPTFEVFGQPGCWQDAACLVGIERLILATYDDPAWVHELLGILMRRKLAFIETMAGARFDLLELGGGDASSTVISPRLFDRFVAPYDSQLIAAAHAAGQRIVYHTCGGMMPILENIVAMGPDAIETLTPPAMGGDVDLAEARRRLDNRVCFIGGFDQFHYFTGCTEAETRAAVRRCFAEAGAKGGYILCPSDHFFDADPALIKAYADEAKQCRYD